MGLCKENPMYNSVSTRVDDKTYDRVCKLARKQGKSISEVLRGMVARGLGK